MLWQVGPSFNYQQDGAHVSVYDGVEGWLCAVCQLPHGSLLALLHVAQQLVQAFGC